MSFRCDAAELLVALVSQVDQVNAPPPSPVLQTRAVEQPRKVGVALGRIGDGALAFQPEGIRDPQARSSTSGWVTTAVWSPPNRCR
jgi:hypothetical protein